jgi:hypothetical protein
MCFPKIAFNIILPPSTRRLAKKDVWSSTTHKPAGLQGLLQRQFTSSTSTDFDIFQLIFSFRLDWLTSLSWALLDKPPISKLLKNFPRHFMEPKGSLRCSQGPANGPYPKLHQHNPYQHILSLYDPFSYYLRLDLPSGLFPSGFPTNILRAYSYCIPCPFPASWLGNSDYTVFQKELFNFESLYKCIQRTCTVFWTVMM